MLATSWAGSLPTWLLLAFALLAAWSFRKGGGGTAIGSLEAANRVLEKRVLQLEKQSKTDAAVIAELRGRTDVTLAIAPILEWSGRHEERAQSRHEATLAVLQLVADRLGPDPNGPRSGAPQAAAA